MYNHEEYIKQNKRQGKGGWRLPTIQELLTLVDYTTHDPASGIDINSGYYWSSTTFARNAAFAWAVAFNAGFSYYYGSLNIRYVRCVRDTQDGLEWSEDAPAEMTWDEGMEYAESLNV